MEKLFIIYVVGKEKLATATRFKFIRVTRDIHIDELCRKVLANQRSGRCFSHEQKRMRPIKIANDVFHMREN